MTDQTQSASDAPSHFVKLCGRAFAAIGFIFFATYLIYLPAPHLFEFGVITDIGLVLYSLSSAGCAMVAWGSIMAALNTDSIKKSVVMKASALGFLLLGLMRLGTAAFPHAPFEDLRVVAITECLIFIAIAIKLHRSS